MSSRQALLCGLALCVPTHAVAQPPSPVPVPLTPHRTGYVSKYTIDLTRGTGVYFRVTLSDSQTAATNEIEYVLSRDVLSDQADKADSALLAVPWATAVAGAIATVKDAALAGKKVKVEYTTPVRGTLRRILSVSLINQ